MDKETLNPIRPDEGLRGPDAKNKVNINRLKQNFAYVIIGIKSLLMQNFRLAALLVLEIRRHKISLEIREQVIKFGCLPPENGFNLKEKSFYVQNRSSRPKIDPHVNFSNFQKEEIFSFSKCLGCLNEKEQQQPP